MYAIVEDSGTQIMVRQGDLIDIDLRDVPENEDTIKFGNVLAVGDQQAVAKLGKPYLSGASVTAEIIGEVSGDKLAIVKYTRRKGYRRKTGHKQGYLRVKITSING